MSDLRTWVKRWNEASLRRIATLPEPSASRRWPLFGMFAIGLFAGAIGSYAVTQRSQIRRLATLAFMARQDAFDDLGGDEVTKPVSVTSHRSNHRRKAAVEVK